VDVRWLTYAEVGNALNRPPKSINRSFKDDRLAGVDDPAPRILMLDGQVIYRGKADPAWTSKPAVLRIGDAETPWPPHVQTLLDRYDERQLNEAEQLRAHVQRLEHELEGSRYELEMLRSEMLTVTAERERMRQERDAARHRERVAKDLALQATRAFSEDVVEIVEARESK